MGCVVRTLDPVAPPAEATATASDHWRLLAFAAARLDRHSLARDAFRAWVSLRVTNRLSAADTPPVIYKDYVAALLAANDGVLDLAPRIAWRPSLPPPTVAAADLPVPAPPQRSDRDHASDIVLAIDIPIAWPLRADDRRSYGPSYGLGLSLEMTITSSLRAGLDVRGLRLGPATSASEPLLLPLVGLRSTWIGHSGSWGELGASLVVGGGAAVPTIGATTLLAVVAPSLRYAWPGGDHAFGRARASPLASFIEVGYALLIATDGGSSHLAVLRLGIELRPGGGRPQPPKAARGAKR